MLPGRTSGWMGAADAARDKRKRVVPRENGITPARTRRNGAGSLDFTVNYTMNGGAGWVVLVKLKRETIDKMRSAVL